MEDREKLNQLSIREQEIKLKEKELELRERELKIKELEVKQAEHRKEKLDATINTIKEKVAFSPNRKLSANTTSFFSLSPEDNSKIWSYKGRLSRKGYIFFNIPYTIISLILLFLLQVFLEASLIMYEDPTFAYVIYCSVITIASIPWIYASIKRCRDCGINPWWTVVFAIIPITGFYLWFAKSSVSVSTEI